MEMKEIANYLEVAMIARQTEDEVEEEEESYAEPAAKKVMTKEELMDMNKTSTDVVANQLETMR
eukprot:12207262-Heterocapsa_arctica.AAC.1